MTIAPVASPSFADDHSELQGLQLVPSPRVFTQPTPPPPLADLFANPSARALFGFDPVAIYSFLIFNAFVIYLVYIAVADRKDRLHGKQQAQLLRGKLAHRLDKELLAVLPDDQLHKAVVHIIPTLVTYVAAPGLRRKSRGRRTQS